MRTSLFIIPILVCGFCSTAQGQEQVLMQLPPTAGQYALEEITFQLENDGANPYDPAQIAVDGEFTSPSGKKLLVPAFWRAAPEGAEAAPCWTLRFAPMEIGTYIVRLKVSRGGRRAEQVGIAAFDSVPSDRPGFVARAGRYLRLTGGEPFFPVGVNRCWANGGNLDAYLQDMRAFADTGGDSLRVWLAPWWVQIEGRPGEYDAAESERLDAILRQAEALGLRLMICIEQHGNLQREHPQVALWKDHPYNAANGGPCRRPADFFVNSEARRLFRNRLRYLAARWGYSSSVMAWELFNEVELSDFGEQGFDANRRNVASWHREMANCLRELDPWRHLVATSSDVELQRRLAGDGALDMVQLHVYEWNGVAESLSKQCRELADTVQAPLLVGEFGAHGKGFAPDLVTEGVVAAAVAGGGTGAWPWLQDEADPAPGYARLQAARLFLQSVAWEQEEFEPLPAVGISYGGGEARAVGAKGRRQILLVVWPAANAAKGEKLTLLIGGAAGRFTCEVCDLQRGETLQHSIVTGSAAGLSLELPALSGPAGFKLEQTQ